MDASVSHVSADHAALAAQYREQISQYKSLNAELADLEWTLTDVERQVAALRQPSDLSTSSDPQRISDLERWKNALEEQILQRLYRVETLATSIAHLRLALDHA